MPDDKREPRTPRQRLRNAFFGKPTRGQVIMAVALAGVGFAAMTQVQSNERDDDYAGLRQEDLVRVLDGLSASTQRVEREIDRLRETREELRSSTSQRSAALEQAREDAEVYGILAGTRPAQGPGIRITIDDPPGEIRATVLLDAIQELRAAGAEVIEFNDKVRFVAQSSVSENAQGLAVDGELLENPYVIDVIGDPATLSEALVFPGGLAEQVRAVVATLNIEERDEIVVESVVPTPDAEFINPDG